MAKFVVDIVNCSAERLKRTTVKQAVTALTDVTCEATFTTLRSDHVVEVVGTIKNIFVAAIHIAYEYHYPLVLTPDLIWMCIAQGFATHVNSNAEKLRHLFVEHEGKKTLKVRRDDFVKGSASNPWPEVFENFSSQINQHVGDKIYGALTPSFTTTGPVERAAAQLVIMDSFKEYFQYRMRTRCGIPEITLQGTVEDWIELKEKAMALKDFELSWWTDELAPVLHQFVEAASGRVDSKFWSSIYKIKYKSGGPYVSGWITTLFPYIGKDNTKNQYMHLWFSGDGGNPFCGVTTDQFSPGFCSTPFIWEFPGTEYAMQFYSGFMAVSQDPNTLALRPEIGWAVADQHSQAKEDLRI